MNISIFKIQILWTSGSYPNKHKVEIFENKTNETSDIFNDNFRQLVFPWMRSKRLK